MQSPGRPASALLVFLGACASAQAGPLADGQLARENAEMIVRVVDAPKPAYTIGTMAISAPWSRATAKRETAAAQYFTIFNNGKAVDRLIGCTASFGTRCEMQDTITIGENVTMRFLDSGMEIKPGKSLELKPGGYHVMMVGLKTPLKEGDKVRGTLEFEIAGSVDIEYVTIGLNAPVPGTAPVVEPPKPK